MLHADDLQGMWLNAARKTANSASLSDRRTPESRARMKLLPSRKPASHCVGYALMVVTVFRPAKPDVEL